MTFIVGGESSNGVPDGRSDEKAVWEALLRQAGANLQQAEASRANCNAILAHTQRMIHAELNKDIAPDRLDSWYCADGDAKDVTSIAEEIVKAASLPNANFGDSQKGGVGPKRTVRVLVVVAQSSKIFHENYRGPRLVPREFSTRIIVEIMCNNRLVFDMFFGNQDLLQPRDFSWSQFGSTRIIVEMPIARRCFSWK